MADTYADVQTQVASDLKRSDLTTAIAAEILNAIRDHSEERFWFNETRSYSLSLSAGTSAYTLSSSGTVQEFIRIDRVDLGISSSQRVRLDYVSPEEMADLHLTDSTSQPSRWTHYADQVRVHPIPGTSYTATIHGHVRLTTLSTGTSANAWTSSGAAANLIRYSTLKRLYAYPIRNVEQAQVATAAETLELEYLRRSTDRRKRSGRMQPYYG